MKLGILGGDLRQISMITALQNAGHEIFAWGLPEEAHLGAVHFEKDAEQLLSKVDAAILPLPATRDGVYVPTPLLSDTTPLRLDTVFCAMKGKRIFGGQIKKELADRAADFETALIDYYDDEILQVENALPSAEGAIFLAMQHLPTVLFGTKVAVTGFGRIGELLARRLLALGANVTVYARREEILKRAEQASLIAHKIDEGHLAEIDPETRILFNTVPEILFHKTLLSTFPKQCLYMELASAPGGMDICAAKEYGIRSIWGGGLPGKYAPESAGISLAAAILRAMREDSDKSGKEENH